MGHSAPSPLEPIVARISRLMAEMESHAFQQEGFAELSMRQVFYLETIAQLEQPSFSQLAQATGVTRPSATAIVARLIDKGLVCKVQDKTDRRSFHIHLTEKGRAFSQAHAALHQRLALALTAHLTPAEAEQLTALLNKAILQTEA